MNTFILKFKKGEVDCECFVQELRGRQENIYIVNFANSQLIRQFHGTKAILHVDRLSAGARQHRKKDIGQLTDQIQQLLEEKIL